MGVGDLGKLGGGEEHLFLGIKLSLIRGHGSSGCTCFALFQVVRTTRALVRTVFSAAANLGAHPGKSSLHADAGVFTVVVTPPFFEPTALGCRNI